MPEDEITQPIELRYPQRLQEISAISLKAESDQPLENFPQDHIDSLRQFVVTTSQFLANNSTLALREEEPHITQAQGQTVRKRITAVLSNNADSIVVALLNGALPSTLKLQDQQTSPDARNRINLVNITTYSENNKTIFSDLIDTAPAQVFNEQNLVMLHDDVADSLRSVATFVLARRLSRLGLDFNDSDSQIIDALAKSRDFDFEESIHLYDQLVPLMQQENVLVAMLFHKNRPFLEVLRQYIQDEPDNQWALAQQEFVGDDVLLYDQQTWLMGGPGLDTGFSGQQLITSLPNELKNHPSLIQYLNTASQLTFRIGAVCEGLIALKPEKADDFLSWVTEKFIIHLHKVSQSA